MIVERKLTAEELAEILRVPLEAARAVAIRNEWRFERDRRGRLRISVPDQFLKAQAAAPRPQGRRAAPSEMPASPKRKAASAPVAAAEATAARPAAKARPSNHRSPPAAATAPKAETDSRPPQRRAESGAGAGAREATEAVPPPSKEAGRQDAFSLQVRVSSLESQIETLLKLALLERQRAEEAIAERNHWRDLAERLIEALPDSSSWLRRWLH